MKIYRERYSSSVHRSLLLTAEFFVPDDPKPLCLFFHGWHMTAEESRNSGEISRLLKDYFVVSADMRGRAGCPGKPDASGHELLDAIDAAAHARKNWPDKVSCREVRGVGGSGGGGNLLALAGKSPDFFASAVSWAGMSDYAAWYANDKKGRYRDEMETSGWIGGNPNSNPEGYFSRGGIHLAENVLTRLLVIHGVKDEDVPVSLARSYENRAKSLKKDNISFIYNNKGHSSMEWPAALQHLNANVGTPVIEKRGSFLLHSFLALRPFWIIPSDPSDMGVVDYLLDGGYNLQRMDFRKRYTAHLCNSYVLRIFNDVEHVRLLDQHGGKSIIAANDRFDDGYRDFLFACDGSFSIEVD